MGIPIDSGDNADWTKQTWDLFILSDEVDEDGFPKHTLVDNLEKLHKMLKQDGMTPEEFKKLAVCYRFNVDKPEMKWLKEL